MLKKTMKIVGLIFGLLVIATLGRFYSEGQRSITMAAPTIEGLKCPDKPNCVSSLASDPDHQIAPLKVGTPGAQIIMVMEKLDIKVTQPSLNHIHGEHTSFLFKFVDDIDVLLPTDGHGDIHIRSASRVGHSDLGKNRAIVEAMRAAL